MPGTPPRGRAGPFGFDSRHADAVGARGCGSLLGWDCGVYPEPAQHPLPFPPARSHRESKYGCMGAAAPPEHPRAILGGPRSWASFIFITPNSCIPPALEEDAAVLRCGASLAPCNLTGFVPPLCVPSRDPQVPGDSGASRAFSAVDHPARGHGAMTGLIFALQHSSAYFFEIS